MNSNSRNWARLAFFVAALLLSSGILVSALVSEGSALGSNEFMLLLAIVGLGLITYRELEKALRAEANDGGRSAAKSHDGAVQKGAAINDVCKTESGSLVLGLKARRALVVVVLLCVLSFPVALVGIPAVLDARPLSRRELGSIVFLELAVIVCSVIAWRRFSRLSR